MRSIKRFLEVMSDKYLYCILLVVGIVIGYYTYKFDIPIPKNDLWDGMKYYFSDYVRFFKILLFNIICGVIFLTLGATIFYNIHNIYLDYILVITIIAVILGIAEIILSLYFFYIAFFLILIIAVLGGAAIGVIHLSNKK
jgi:hypothetical protein